jgi:hypothetical protein
MAVVMVAASPDGFAWGAPGPAGIALGLRLDPRSPPGTCAYRIAVANRSGEPKQVVLFATLDNKIRTRIIARQNGSEEVRGAVVPAVPLTSNIRIVVDLAPGQVIERTGAPAQFELSGAAVVHVVMGGVRAHPDELKSGEVPVTLAPAS